MPTTNFDASWITKKNRDVALYSWKQQQTTAVNSGVNTILAEQPNTQISQVVTNRNLGCMYCQTNVAVNATSNVVTYPFTGSGGGGPTGGAFPGQ